MQPCAREDGLLVQQLGEETLVYDRMRHQVHCLNPTVAAVWGQCDGRTSVAEIAERLRSELRAPADENLVWLALERLDTVHLLREPLTRPAGTPRFSRRELARNLRLVGGLAALLPVITSIVAPTPSQAGSCGPCAPGQNGGAPCGDCTKTCVNGVCM